MVILSPSMVWLSSANYDTPHAHTVRDTLPTIAEKSSWRKREKCTRYRLSNCCVVHSDLLTNWAVSSFVHCRCHTFLENEQLTVVQCVQVQAVANCSIIIVHFVIDDSFHHRISSSPLSSWTLLFLSFCVCLCVCSSSSFPFWLSLSFLFFAINFGHSTVLKMFLPVSRKKQRETVRHY